MRFFFLHLLHSNGKFIQPFYQTCHAVSFAVASRQLSSHWISFLAIISTALRSEALQMFGILCYTLLLKMQYIVHFDHTLVSSVSSAWLVIIFVSVYSVITISWFLITAWFCFFRVNWKIFCSGGFLFINDLRGVLSNFLNKSICNFWRYFHLISHEFIIDELELS